MRLKQVTAMLVATSCIVSACSAEDRTGKVANLMEGNTVVAANEARIIERASGPRSTRPKAAERVIVSSERGQVTVELVRNEATEALLRMLPLTIAMRDHAEQEKTGSLPSSLPEQPRQLGFSAGTVGLWGNDDLVIYYRDGRVPPPGIIVLGRVNGSASIFDVPGPLTVRIQRGD